MSLEMSGAIKRGGRWHPFTAVPILRAGTGFVCAPFVGGRFIRFAGADALGPDGRGLSSQPPTWASFGGSVDSNHVCPTGVHIAGSGTVGWDWQTPQQPAGEFFRYRIISPSRRPVRQHRTNW